MLTHVDFILSPTELQAIDRRVCQRAEAIASEGEDSPQDVNISFTFSAAFGRSVHVRVDGEVVGVEIESLLIDFDPGVDGGSGR